MTEKEKEKLVNKTYRNIGKQLTWGAIDAITTAVAIILVVCYVLNWFGLLNLNTTTNDHNIQVFICSTNTCTPSTTITHNGK